MNVFKKILIAGLSVAALGAATVSNSEARPFGHGGRAFYPQHYGYHGGYGGGFGGGYHHRGFGVGPAIGLGLLGLGVGAAGYGLYNGYSNSYNNGYNSDCVDQYGYRVSCNYNYGY